MSNVKVVVVEDLKILGIVCGDNKIEKEFHKKFKHYRIRGEWFYYTKELEEYLNESWDFSTIESLEKKMLKKLTNKPSEVNYDK
jgi:hypothetical protein